MTATASNGNIKSILLLLTGTMILCSIPGLAAVFNWNWQPDHASVVTHFFYFVSLSTNALIALIPVILWQLKLNRKKSMIVLCIISAILLSSLVIKSSIKKITEKPRPFAVWLQKTNISTNAQQTDALLMSKSFKDESALLQQNIPIWQQSYWANSSKYSFPSGHSLFAAIMALLTLTLLWRKKAYALITIVMIWACLVETSRLALGMHWPHDIAASCAIAVILLAAGIFAWNKWVFNSPNEQQ